MIDKDKNASILLFLPPLFIAIAGGICFGLFSCGGFLWKQQFFTILFTASLLLFFVFPFSTIKAFAIRLVVGDIVISIFIVTRAGASVFYPGTPNSWTEFVISFLNGLMHGPC
ncbi:MAG: hypothetical protein WBN83_03445 [Desulfoprunum sp.]|jgi:hypothetical protein|uniref:hypothetical protein n=1 Tax=Desulfoprunum sp. TaxID=2020866 RepID=UPI003C760427